MSLKILLEKTIEKAQGNLNYTCIIYCDHTIIMLTNWDGNKPTIKFENDYFFVKNNTNNEHIIVYSSIRQITAFITPQKRTTYDFVTELFSNIIVEAEQEYIIVSEFLSEFAKECSHG